MNKHILSQYDDAKARVRLLHRQQEKRKKRLAKLDQTGYYVTDVVTRGRKGKKPLGVVIIAGNPRPTRNRLEKLIEKREQILEQEELEMLELGVEVEEYISRLPNIEIRNLLTLYYIEDLNWVQVAHWMNEIYPKKRGCHTDSSCRQRHDRFLQKDLKTAVAAV